MYELEIFKKSTKEDWTDYAFFEEYENRKASLSGYIKYLNKKYGSNNFKTNEDDKHSVAS